MPQITSYTAKSTLVDADEIVIQDSAAVNTKKALMSAVASYVRDRGTDTIDTLKTQFVAQSSEPAGATTGDLAYSDGTVSTNGFGGEGAGLYYYRGSAWRKVVADGEDVTLSTTASGLNLDLNDSGGENRIRAVSGDLQIEVDRNSLTADSQLRVFIDGAEVFTLDASGNLSIDGSLTEGVLSDTYGSNSNGYWTKFVDGTMICRQSDFQTSYFSADECLGTWTYPQAFSAAPVVCSNPRQPISAAPNRYELAANIVSGITTTSATIRQCRVSGLTDFQSGNITNHEVIAIGRWA